MQTLSNEKRNMTRRDLNGLKPLLRDCADCPVRKMAVCSCSSTDELQIFNWMKTGRPYTAGDLIVRKDKPINYVGTIISGMATISRESDDGRRQITGILTPGDFIGQTQCDRAQFDITAVQDVVMCSFEVHVFEHLLTVSPMLGPRLLELALNKLNAARDWMFLLGRKSARERIATFLYRIAWKSRSLFKNSSDGAFEFTLPFSRDILADYLGLTIETVSRQLNALHDDGVIGIKRQRWVAIPDFQRLSDETGDDNRVNGLP